MLSPRGSSLRNAILLLVLVTTGIAGCQQSHRPKQVAFRPFDSIFTKIRDLPLAGVDPRHATAFAMDSKGNIYVADAGNRTVRKFDAQGHLLRSIGEMGWEPGNFIKPWSLACDNSDNLYVLDIHSGRISRFDQDGNFKDSIVVSALGFSGVALKLNANGELYVGGIRRPHQSESPLLYKPGKDGRLLASFFPEDSAVTKLNLTLVGMVWADLDSSGNIYAVQPVSTKVSVFSPEGRLLREFGRVPSFYVPPVKFPGKLPSDHNKVQALLDQWTELSDIEMIKPKHLLLLTFNVHSPVAYALELYRENGDLVAGDIGSAVLPAFTTAQGHIYFYDPAATTLTLTEVSLT